MLVEVGIRVLGDSWAPVLYLGPDLRLAGWAAPGACEARLVWCLAFVPVPFIPLPTKPSILVPSLLQTPTSLETKIFRIQTALLAYK